MNGTFDVDFCNIEGGSIYSLDSREKIALEIRGDINIGCGFYKDMAV